MADVSTLADRIEIIQHCTQVHWCYDHEAWQELELLFAEVVSMPTVAQALDPGFDADYYLERYLAPRHDVLRGLRAFKDGLTTQHLVTGHRVAVRADTAVCHAHSINIHILAGADSVSSLLAHGNDYRFDLLRTRDGWRIRGWIPQVRWLHGDPAAHDVAAKQEAWLQNRLRTQ